ncbi:MAG: hypothetical protein K2X81_15495, partial [Candidatus Obscuribacterales bacterium]|nr:hypothetical protein [Candidatus Obscuribacterales bacterium]
MSEATKNVYKVTVAESCPVLLIACDQGGVFNTYSDQVFLDNYSQRTGLSHTEIREIVLDCQEKI